MDYYLRYLEELELDKIIRIRSCGMSGSMVDYYPTCEECNYCEPIIQCQSDLEEIIEYLNDNQIYPLIKYVDKVSNKISEDEINEDTEWEIIIDEKYI